MILIRVICDVLDELNPTETTAKQMLLKSTNQRMYTWFPQYSCDLLAVYLSVAHHLNIRVALCHDTIRLVLAGIYVGISISIITTLELTIKQVNLQIAPQVYENITAGGCRAHV